LQVELLKLQNHIFESGEKHVIVFEGRDAAGKGGTIKRFMEHLNPRYARVVALTKLSDREQREWYFQRYVSHLPTGGEIALFDRSWYNRAGVERVMGFATDEQYERFMKNCPEVEHFIVEGGIKLIKIWLEVSPDEQRRRFEARVEDPLRQWKLSPMDLPSLERWYDYSKARDRMFKETDTDFAPWYILRSDDKRTARLNAISHILSQIPYKKLPHERVKLPARKKKGAYDDQA